LNGGWAFCRIFASGTILGGKKPVSLAQQLRNYRLTTAEIIYHMPDHPGVLQKFIWQELDIAPLYPVLRRFLDFWQRNLDGKLHSVRVASTKLIKPNEFRLVQVRGVLILH
jgi:uncharacterized protein Usg